MFCCVFGSVHLQFSNNGQAGQGIMDSASADSALKGDAQKTRRPVNKRVMIKCSRKGNL